MPWGIDLISRRRMIAQITSSVKDTVSTAGTMLTFLRTSCSGELGRGQITYVARHKLRQVGYVFCQTDFSFSYFSLW